MLIVGSADGDLASRARDSGRERLRIAVETLADRVLVDATLTGPANAP